MCVFPFAQILLLLRAGFMVARSKINAISLMSFPGLNILAHGLTRTHTHTQMARTYNTHNTLTTPLTCTQPKHATVLMSTFIYRQVYI